MAQYCNINCKKISTTIFNAHFFCNHKIDNVGYTIWQLLACRPHSRHDELVVMAQLFSIGGMITSARNCGMCVLHQCFSKPTKSRRAIEHVPIPPRLRNLLTGEVGDAKMCSRAIFSSRGPRGGGGPPRATLGFCSRGPNFDAYH